LYNTIFLIQKQLTSNKSCAWKSCKQLMPITPDKTLDNARCVFLRETAHQALSSVFASYPVLWPCNSLRGIIPWWHSLHEFHEKSHDLGRLHNSTISLSQLVAQPSSSESNPDITKSKGPSCP
jgi:hypothetical protein